MQKFAIILLILTFSGCASFKRTEVIDVDKAQGYATGTYNEDSGGKDTKFALGGSGGGWGGGSAGGFGAAFIAFQSGPPTSGSRNFAGALAMINYSKSLKSIKYDETGGVITYEFEHEPSTADRNTNSKKYRPAVAQPQAPSAFGYQPIE